MKPYPAAQESVSSISMSLAVRGSIDTGKVPGAPSSHPPEWLDLELDRRVGMTDAVAFAEFLEASVERDIPGARIRAVANPPSNDTAGPGLPIPELLHFLLGDDPTTRVAAYLDLAERVPRVIRWLRDHGGEIEEIGEDVAIAVAVPLALEASTSVAIAYVSVAAVQPHPTNWESPRALGWLVLFRTDDDFLEVAVSRSGEAFGLVHRPHSFLEIPSGDEPAG